MGLTGLIRLTGPINLSSLIVPVSPISPIHLQSFATPEYFPLGEHYARVVSGLFERLARPIADGRARDQPARRAHGPELFIKTLAGEQRLPLAPGLTMTEPVCQAANKSERRAVGCRGRQHVVKRLLAT